MSVYLAISPFYPSFVPVLYMLAEGHETVSSALLLDVYSCNLVSLSLTRRRRYRRSKQPDMLEMIHLFILLMAQIQLFLTRSWKRGWVAEGDANQ